MARLALSRRCPRSGGRERGRGGEGIGEPVYGEARWKALPAPSRQRSATSPAVTDRETCARRLRFGSPCRGVRFPGLGAGATCLSRGSTWFQFRATCLDIELHVSTLELHV